MSAPHVPVMAAEVTAALAPHGAGLYVDGTFGAGGYTRAMHAAGAGRIVAIDRDPDAIAAGRALEQELAGALTLVEGRFGEMDSLLRARGLDAVDGVALDLGVSSMQLDRPDRGFSFRGDGPLDMRMSQSGESAADVVNAADERDLADIVFRYGEERAARRVARAIVEARKETPISRTAQLAEIVRRAIGMRGAPPAIDPATRTFQALRIWVNDELGELERGLEAAERVLRPGGRLAVVSFHSLEDRVVKTFMRERSEFAARGSRHAPDSRFAAPRREERRPGWRLVTRKPTSPGDAEIAANPRARSARLRVAERLATEAAS